MDDRDGERRPLLGGVVETSTSMSDHALATTYPQTGDSGHHAQDQRSIGHPSGTAYTDTLCLLRIHPAQQEEEDRSAERQLIIVALLSALFIVTQVIGGIWANSLAILTDAGHMLSDFLSFVLSIAMIRLSRKPANPRFTFGYLRAEVFGALMSVFIVWTLTVVLVVLATQRAMSREAKVEADPMLLTAVLGLLFNVVVACILRWGGGSVHHHLSTTRNFNVRAALIHVIGDFLHSIGVIVASVLIKYTQLMIIDPLCSYIFSILVLATSVGVFKDVVLVLMEAAPTDSTDYPKLYHELASIDGVKGVHSFHAWALGSNSTAVSVHIIADVGVQPPDTITRRANHVLKHSLNASFITVQVEPAAESSAPDNEIEGSAAPVT